MRLTFPLLRNASGSASSKQWLSRQTRDPFIKARSVQAYRSRAAFKLLQMNERYKLFGRDNTDVAIDLGAAPGGWSQVLADVLLGECEGAGKDLKKIRKEKKGVKTGLDKEDKEKYAKEMIAEILAGSKIANWSLGQGGQETMSSDTASISELQARASKAIIAVDILPLSPIRGVHTIRQDFLDPRADELIATLLPSSTNTRLVSESYADSQPVLTHGNLERKKADIILSDIALNVSGNRAKDVQACLDVCHAVFRFAAKHLRGEGEGKRPKGGNLVMKYFADNEVEEFRRVVLDPAFRSVNAVKPEASRSESSETYFVCRGFK